MLQSRFRATQGKVSHRIHVTTGEGHTIADNLVARFPFDIAGREGGGLRLASPRLRHVRAGEHNIPGKSDTTSILLQFWIVQTSSGDY
jgi:hypothetical protein